MHDQIVDFLEYIIRHSYAWLTTNDEILGKIVYVIHLTGFWTLMTLIFVSHVFPYFWFQVGVFVFVFIAWIQHIVLNTCVLTSLEIRFLRKRAMCMIDSLLQLVDIPTTSEIRMGVTALLSTTMVLFLGLELMAGVFKPYTASSIT